MRSTECQLPRVFDSPKEAHNRSKEFLRSGHLIYICFGAWGFPKKGKQVADPMSMLDGMAKRLVGVDSVVVPSTHAGSLNIASIDKIGDNSLGGAFGNPDLSRDIASTYARVIGDANHHVAVVGEERPLRLCYFLTRMIWVGHHTKCIRIRE